MVAVRATLGGLPSALPQGARYLIVDRHSIILAYPELRKLHERSAFAARQELTMRLRHYQDWTGPEYVSSSFSMGRHEGQRDPGPASSRESLNRQGELNWETCESEKRIPPHCANG